MKKNMWTKRIALVGLYGLLSSSLLTSCGKKELEETYPVYNLTLAEYNTMDKKCVKIMKQWERDGSTSYLESITEPNIKSIVTDFDNDEEKCIVYSDGQECEFIKGEVDHKVYRYFKKDGSIEDINISKDRILELENTLESEKNNTQKQISEYLDDYFEYQQAIDANEEVHITREIGRFKYKIEDRIEEKYVYLDTRSENEKIYRSITQPLESIIVKIDEEKQEKYYLSTKNEILELNVVQYFRDMEHFMTYKGAEQYEKLGYLFNNHSKLKKNADSFYSLFFEVNNERFMRMAKYIGQLDNKKYYQNVSIDDEPYSFWVIEDLEKNATTKYEILAPLYFRNLDASISFVEMNEVPGLTSLTIEEALEIEKEYKEELVRGGK